MKNKVYLFTFLHLSEKSIQPVAVQGFLYGERNVHGIGYVLRGNVVVEWGRDDPVSARNLASPHFFVNVQVNVLGILDSRRQVVLH